FLAGRGTLVETGTSRSSPRTAALSIALAASAQQHQVLSDNLRFVLLFTALLVFPARGLEPALDVNLGAFLHVLADDFRQALPGNDVVPFCPVLPLTRFVFVALVRRQAELGYGNAAGSVLDLRVFTEVPNQNHFVDALWHEGSTFYQ